MILFLNIFPNCIYEQKLFILYLELQYWKVRLMTDTMLKVHCYLIFRSKIKTTHSEYLKSYKNFGPMLSARDSKWQSSFYEFLSGTFPGECRSACGMITERSNCSRYAQSTFQSSRASRIAIPQAFLVQGIII